MVSVRMHVPGPEHDSHVLLGGHGAQVWYRRYAAGREDKLPPYMSIQQVTGILTLAATGDDSFPGETARMRMILNLDSRDPDVLKEFSSMEAAVAFEEESHLKRKELLANNESIADYFCIPKSQLTIPELQKCPAPTSEEQRY